MTPGSLHGLESPEPSPFRQSLPGYAWVAQDIGRSDAAVFRLHAPGHPTLFVKTATTQDAASELPDEVARLRWLTAQGMACPQVLEYTESRDHAWLLMTALPGSDLASSPELAPARITHLAAAALRSLHSLDPAHCPFDHCSAVRIGHARERMQAGLVDENDFDDERMGQGAAQVFKTLLQQRPAHEDLVVTHGDACLPNLMAAQGVFTGFIDCGRLGVADRHQDLALAAWSIQYNVGAEWVAPFLDAYGGVVEPGKLAFYRLLDEFF